jgi:uncharacterized protein (TIGR02271 family)
MSSSSYADQVSVGDEVYGSDGDKVGNVAEVQSSYIVVEKGLFFPTDYYIPLSAIGSASGGQVALNVAKDAALNSGWDTVPDVVPTGMTDSGTVFTDGDVRTTERDLVDVGLTDRLTGTAQVADSDEIRIPVMEEELTATVREQQAGAVRIEKDVITEERTLEVPVTEERIRVERRIVDRAVTGADAGAFEETVIEVPLRSETVDVHKEVRVTGEVVVSKEAVQRTETVTDTVRREEVYVDEDAVIGDATEGEAPRSR